MDATIIRSNLATNNVWLERGIVAIDARQTSDEQSSGQTKYENGRGWNSADASYGSYLARYIRSGRHLSGQHLQRARRMMAKYAGQLAKVAAAKQAAKDQEAAAQRDREELNMMKGG